MKSTLSKWDGKEFEIDRCEWCDRDLFENEDIQIWHYDDDGCHEICGPCHDSVNWKGGKPVGQVYRLIGDPGIKQTKERAIALDAYFPKNG